MEPPSSAYSTSNRITVQGDPGRAFRPTGRARHIPTETQDPPRCARRVLPRLPAWPSACTALAGFARSAMRRSGPAVPGLRYPACAAACMARAASSLRSGTGHASRYVVGNVHRPRCSNALPILAAARLARSPVLTVFGDVLPPRTSRASRRRLSRAVLKDPRPLPRATVLGHADGHSPLPPDPGLRRVAGGGCPPPAPTEPD